MNSIQRFFALSLSLAASTVYGDVLFNNCSEFVGTGPIPLANAQPYVPATFQIAGASSGSATLVARVSNCASVSVDGSEAVPTTLSHIGVIVVGPDGTGDINNYTVVYVTNNKKLADRLQKGGLPAYVDEKLKYEVTPAVPTPAGELYAQIVAEDGPTYLITGSVTQPDMNGAFPFVANWWYESKKGRLKMATSIPSIAFGQSAGVVRTSKTSVVGKLIGGNTFSNFNGFNVRGVFPTGRMVLTVH